MANPKEPHNISAQSLIDAVKEQRNDAFDNLATAQALVRHLEAKITALEQRLATPAPAPKPAEDPPGPE